uniref:Uncharacterized protein n=1 Tax=Rhizophora mucronata TaxID=61149 RepID=A0A2P2ND22_RHIMU
MPSTDKLRKLCTQIERGGHRDRERE